MNGAPRNAREELIAELEGLGYDAMPGVRKDWADWRERLSDDDLQAVILRLRLREIFAIIHEEMDRDEALAAAEARAARPVESGEDSPPDFPDIPEMVDALREAVSTADAWLEANPGVAEDLTPEWEAWNRSFTTLRDLVARIDSASVRGFGASDA